MTDHYHTAAQTGSPATDGVILVTGAAGFIGGHLCAALAAAGASRIIILDDMSAAYDWNLCKHPAVTVIRGDVSDDVTLDAAFAHRPTIIYHLAAFFANQNSVDHPQRDLQVNGLGTLKLLQRATATLPGGAASPSAPVTRFVYASSGCSIYGTAARPRSR
jgi:UDP-glucose 4-epimerase